MVTAYTASTAPGTSRTDCRVKRARIFDLVLTGEGKADAIEAVVDGQANYARILDRLF
jgi:hypothetical protein